MLWEFVILLMLFLAGINGRWRICTKKVVFRKSRFLELEFKDDYKVLPMCGISTLEARRLLHKRCEAYLAYVVVKFSPEVTLDNVSVVQKF